MTTTPDAKAPPSLPEHLDAEIIFPGDPGYDAARTVFLPAVDRRPAAIIRPRRADQVLDVIRLAREGGLELAVRSGGHSSAGHGVTEGGIVLDLARLKALDVDPAKRIAWAETGLTAGEFTVAAQQHGLGVSFGDTGSVGIGGLTLGGGVGYLVRKHGLTIDQLLAAEIVTADGRLLHVDAERHPELYWAIRGGGGNFGVATRFQFRLHAVENVTGGMLVVPASASSIASFVAAAAASPVELSTIANVMPAPPLPFVPAEQHGKTVIFAMMLHAGPHADAERVLAPFRSIATPIVDQVRPMTLADMYPPDEGFRPLAAGRTMFLETVDEAVAARMLDQLRVSTAQMAVVQIRVLGGAMTEVPAEATAFAHRASPIMLNVAAIYAAREEAPVHEEWAGAAAAALKQGDLGAYVNFVGDEGEAGVRAAYPGPTWDRLAEVKRMYDPDNFFHLNQNVPPAA